MALILTLLGSEDAQATPFCDKGCAGLAYALVTVGGVVTAAGAQVSLLQGERDEGWGYASLGFAAANGVTGAVLLLIAAGNAAAEDEESANGFALWGGVQMSIAIAGLVSGASIVANDDPERGPPMAPAPTGATISFEF